MPSRPAGLRCAITRRQTDRSAISSTPLPYTAARESPAGQAAADVQQRANDELGGLRESIEPLAQKLASGQVLSAEERDSYDLFRRSIETTSERYRQEFEQAAAPAQADIQAAIDVVAQENGYGVVMDGNVAGQTGVGLVVFAAEGLDITPLVVRRIR